VGTEPITAAPARRPSREYRAVVAFTLSALLALTILVLLRGFLGTPPIRNLVLLIGPSLSIGASFALAFGLANNRPWASAIVTPMLQLLLLAGLLSFLLTVTHGGIEIPFTAVLAIWALRAPMRAASGSTDSVSGRRHRGAAGLLTTAAMAVSVVWPMASIALLANGGPLIVDHDALVPTFTASCDSSPGEPPTFVDVTYAWRWTRAEPVAGGVDTLTLEWVTVRDDGLSGYMLGPMATQAAGISETDRMIGDRPGIIFGIDLATTRFDPGQVTVKLEPPQAPPTGHGGVELAAHYLHSPATIYDPASPALWRIATPARCEW
jgi:hypothetical protein